ncbi:MAG: STM3941 family protein [Bacteroidota bacterium]
MSPKKNTFARQHPPMTTQIKLYKKTWKGLRLVAMGLPLFCVCIWKAQREDVDAMEQLLGWFGSCFFGFGLFVGFFHTFDRRPQIILDEDGIWDRSIREPKVFWEQVRAVHQWGVYGQIFVAVKVDKTFQRRQSKYAWVQPISRLLKGKDLNINLSQLSVDAQQMANCIKEMSKVEKENRLETLTKYFS